jgi:hypothetical protein
MALSARGHRVLDVARRVFELEQQLADLHAELEGELVVASAGRVSEAPLPRQSARADTPGSRPGDDIQGFVLRQLLARPGHLFRAGELKALLGGQPAKGSVESALQRLSARGEIQLVDRGSYTIPIPRGGDTTQVPP